MAIVKFIDIKVRSKGAERNVNQLDRKMKGLGRTADGTKKQLGQLSKVALGVFAAVVVTNVVKYADAFSSVQNQIRQTTKTTEQLTQRTAQLLDVANRSRVEFGATAELYTQLTLSTEELNLSTDELLRLTETIGKSFSVSGKSVAESAGAIKQLGQAFAAGALRGDEFNSIAEGAPEIMRALQRSLKLTQGELREFAATGGITSKVLVDALTAAADVIDDKMGKAIKTFAQSTQEANNNMIKFVGQAALVQNVVGGAGKVLVLASENLDNITKFAGIAAATFAARLVPAIGSFTISLLASARAQLFATTASTGFSAAMGIQAKAVTGTTFKVNALALASRGAAGALALIGGPLGAALIAATAIFLFVDATESAEEKTKRLSAELSTLTDSFIGLTKAQRSLEIEKLNIQFRKQKGILDSINDALATEREGAIAGREKSARLSDLNEKLSRQSEILDEISIKQQAVFASGLPDITGKPSAAAPKADIGESKFVVRQKLETEALKRELLTRQLITEGILSEDEANLALSFVNKLRQDEVNLQTELARLATDEDAKILAEAAFKEQRIIRSEIFEAESREIRVELANQQLIDAQSFEEELTEIKQDETDKRISLNQRELQSKVSTFQGILGAAAAFGIKSDKLNKAVRIATGALSAYQIFAATEAASALALAQPPGPPATIGFAAAISASGKIKAGAVLAGAVGGAFSSGGGGVAASRPAVPTVSRATPGVEAQDLPQQTRVVDIRIDPDALLTGTMFRDAMNSIFESDSDIIVNITTQQAEANRIGAN